ncbi:putative carboxylesterase [Candidatus Competibacter denitrificans Run_A_D11]|uniref:Carboxylesterase n=1 Tax=Candidatus Competibacter denitrificans Run_A_D11 TaxID=1400863 RepID=W6M2R7_9GAMM|nr:alpha/beta hydrolase [Candidatus Competibacter denitrificans]CDI01821.1 putative carboxylesterase [Candidatus Competibacter denitrificans Run_A_D11]HAS86082.1 alpha/beta hydrolase [Candidatus Competibacteraceae bacterium]HRC68048.1 alpha/beta hydrolase [Candidatus Competibacter denitrificans]
MAMSSHSYRALGRHGFHRIHYTEWGDPANPNVLICVHGFTRTSRDFDFLAAALEKDYRVLCPDVVGRGKSDWLNDKTEYGYPLYINDLAMLLARIDAERIDWVGTSMGGLIGMFLASYPETPIHKLLINDVGPRIPAAGLKRVADIVGRVITFDSIEHMDRTLRIFAAVFGNLTDAQWRHMIIHNARQLPDGRYTANYDPGIADNLKTMDLQDIDLWSVWDTIRCPTLVLRGANSDVLEHADAIAMTERGPKAQLIELPGMGHAPALMADDQIALVRDWLLAD